MSEKAVLFKKLEELDQYLAELERLRQLTFEELAASLRLRWSVEHGLQLSIQIVLDMGNHILAALGGDSGIALDINVDSLIQESEEVRNILGKSISTAKGRK